MAYIQGFGAYLPSGVVTNDDWASRLDTSDEWITQRTGIKERRVAGPEETTASLATIAAQRAIADANLAPGDVDELIIATDTPEVMAPDTAAFVQDRLGLREVPAFDLAGSGCAGFVLALDVARARIALSPRTVLVIGVELLTRMISQHDRSTAVLFGDGAGAVILSDQPGRAEVLHAVAGTDGSKTGFLTLATGGTAHPFSEEALAAGDHRHLEMDGQEVFKDAVRRMTSSVHQLLHDIDRSPSDVDLVIPHQANKRIIDAVARKLGTDKVFTNVERLGNTGSASVPIALWEAVDTGAIAPGDLVVLTAFGAGFHWASAALQF